MDCPERDCGKDVEMTKKEIVSMVIEITSVIVFIGFMWCVWVVM